MNTLPFSFYRCIGTPNYGREYLEGEAFVISPVCNDCRRREPGHPTRQIHIAPAVFVVDGIDRCDNRISPQPTEN